MPPVSLWKFVVTGPKTLWGLDNTGCGTHRALPRSTFPDDVLLVRGSLTSTIMGKVLACCTSPRRPQSASSTAEERQLLPRLPGAVA